MDIEPMERYWLGQIIKITMQPFIKKPFEYQFMTFTSTILIYNFATIKIKK